MHFNKWEFLSYEFRIYYIPKKKSVWNLILIVLMAEEDYEALTCGTLKEA